MESGAHLRAVAGTALHRGARADKRRRCRKPTPGKISDAVTRVIDLLYGETATGSAADVLAERHLPVAARRFPRAYPLEPGLWRNLLDDDRAFA